VQDGGIQSWPDPARSQDLTAGELSISG
jgi:hypothetical protein